MGRWRAVDHTADFALHVWGDDLPDLFATAAQGMAALTVAETAGTSVMLDVTLDALDVEGLLVDWLNELLYLSERHEVCWTAFVFAELSPVALQATLTGVPIAERGSYIKAATYHNLAVHATPEGFETEIVFDT